LAKAAKGMTALNIAMFASPAGKMAQVFLKLGVAVAGATGGVLLMEALMKDVESLMGEIDEAVDNLSNRPFNLTDKFAEAKRELEAMNRETELMLQSMKTGDTFSVEFFEGVLEARKILDKLNADEQAALSQWLDTATSWTGTTEE